MAGWSRETGSTAREKQPKSPNQVSYHRSVEYPFLFFVLFFVPDSGKKNKIKTQTDKKTTTKQQKPRCQVGYHHHNSKISAGYISVSGNKNKQMQRRKETNATKQSKLSYQETSLSQPLTEPQYAALMHKSLAQPPITIT